MGAKIYHNGLNVRLPVTLPESIYYDVTKFNNLYISDSGGRFIRLLEIHPENNPPTASVKKEYVVLNYIYRVTRSDEVRLTRDEIVGYLGKRYANGKQAKRARQVFRKLSSPRRGIVYSYGDSFHLSKPGICLFETASEIIAGSYLILVDRENELKVEVVSPEDAYLQVRGTS